MRMIILGGIDMTEKKPNKFGLDLDYLELEVPSTIDDYLTWISYKERKIILNDNIDTSTINKVSHWINRWNEEDDKNGLSGDARIEIKIELTSNGGDVVSGLNVVDVVKNSKTKVVITTFACAASMGALILLSGHERVAYKNSIILIHDGSLQLQGSSRKAKNTMSFYDKLDERVKKYILDNTKISEELYDSKVDEEWYMFADEALELGVIDRII